MAAGGEATDVLVGERAEVLVADGTDRPCGGGHGGAGIRGRAAGAFCGRFLGVGNESFSPFRFARRREFAGFKMHGKIRGGTGFFLLLYVHLSRFPFLYVYFFVEQY